MKKSTAKIHQCEDHFKENSEKSTMKVGQKIEKVRPKTNNFPTKIPAAIFKYYRKLFIEN
jgi:hypothetical protein